MTFSKFINHLNSRDTQIFPNISKKIKNLLFVALFFFFVFLSKNIFAQNIVKEKQDAISTGNNQESWMNEALGSNLISIQIMMGGTIPDSVLSGETNPQGYPLTTYRPGGLLGVTNHLISYAFEPAASGVEYIAQVKNNFLGKPAYAQGEAFNSLNKILPLWLIFRNLVYSLFSIFFVITGIMIMLRIKVSPQAVVTIQNSIPRIVTSLVLVTFSYAIAGLCIDLMNFLLAFVLALLFNGLDKNFSDNLFRLSNSGWDLTSMINKIRELGGDNAFNFSNLNSVTFFTLPSLFMRLMPQFALNFLAILIGSSIGFIWGLGSPILTAGGAILGILVVILLEIIIATNIIVFLFSLVKCYVTIILKIIFSPVEIALGAFPNSKMGFSKWITELIANLSVFPASLLFLVIVNILIDYLGGGLWTPIMLSGATSIFLPTMVGIGSIFMLAKLPTLIPEVIFSIKPSPWGKAIGEGFNNSVIGKTAATVQKGVDEAGIKGVANKINKTYNRTTGNVYDNMNNSNVAVTARTIRNKRLSEKTKKSFSKSGPGFDSNDYGSDTESFD